MMDLFGFVKDVGRRLFNKDEEAAEKIKAHIEAANPGVENLGVEYEKGAVRLSGVCSSMEAQEKCVLMAGNVAGVEDVDVSGMKVIEAKTSSAPETVKAETEKPKVEYYVIQPGDTLSKLAKRYYGNAMKYPRLFEANREVIQDPDKIFVGQKIRIPLEA